METKDELQEKIDEYKKQIMAIEEKNATLDRNDIFSRQEIVENNSKIRDYTDRIARLERRINDVPEPGLLTEKQASILEWVASDDYDDDQSY